MKIAGAWAGAVALVLFSVACKSTDAVAPETCSNASLHGLFAVASQGQTGPGVHFALLGVSNFDGRGNISTTSTTSTNGVFTTASAVAETYQINADCTGTIMSASNPLNVIADVVVTEGGLGLIGLSVSNLFNVGVDYESIEGTCSKATLKGTYTLEQGDGIARPNAVHAIGEETFDGNGNETEHANTVRNAVASVFDEKGTYTLASDCTGTETDNANVNFANVVAVHSGHEVFGLSLLAGASETIHLVHNP